MLHAKPLLLVDDEQGQIGDLHILRDQPVGADDDVDLALRGGRQNGLYLLRRPEPRERLDAGTRLAEPTAEGVEVLLTEHGRRDQDGHLLAVAYRLVGGTDRNLGLAEAHITAEQPVHGLVGLHVGEHIVDGPRLVRRLLVGERSLELVVHRIGRGEGKPLARGTLRVEPDQLFGDIGQCSLDASLRSLPGGA